MAEEQPRKCSYCVGEPFRHLRTLVAHMRRKHAEEPDVEERIKALPKDAFYLECPHCHRPQSNIFRHLEVCKERKAGNGEEGDDEAEEDEGFSDEEFLRRFERYHCIVIFWVR